MDNNTSYQRERTAMRMGQLVLKKLDGQLSDAEASELDQWIASAAEYRAVHDEMMDALSRSRAVLYQPPHEADAVLQRVLDRHAQRTSKKHFPLRRLLPYAAAVLLVLASVATYLYIYDARKPEAVVAAADIPAPTARPYR